MIPTGRSAPPGTPRKPCGASTRLTVPLSRSDTPTRLADDLQDESCPPEVNKLGRTIARWTLQITNWHISKVTNGPTEALNNLIKRIKRAAFGLPNFANYRIRALLYAGKPNWDLLAAATPPQNPKSHKSQDSTAVERGDHRDSQLGSAGLGLASRGEAAHWHGQPWRRMARQEQQAVRPGPSAGQQARTPVPACYINGRHPLCGV